MSTDLFAISKVEAEANQGKRDTEPHEENRQHGGERYSAGRSFAPDEEIEKQRGTTNDGWIESCRLGRYLSSDEQVSLKVVYQDSCSFPMRTFDCFVDATSIETSDQTNDKSNHSISATQLRPVVYHLPHENIEKTSSGNQCAS